MLRKVPKRIWVIVAVCVAIYAAWQMAYPSGSWRYKLTVAVETPEGVKVGSAVREVHADTGPKIFPDANPVFHRVTGEAVVVDLGERGQLFALLRNNKSGVDGAYYIVSSAYQSGFFNGADYVRYYDGAVKPPVVLHQMYYPTFVRFRDPRDPKTVEAVKADDFAGSFGEGVTLKSVTIEMTRDPVTTGVVERVLPWLPARKGKRGTLGGGDSITSDPTGTWLTGEEFSMGVYW